MFRWLKPGIGLKRWGALILVSAILFGFGVIGVLSSILGNSIDFGFAATLAGILGTAGLLVGIFGLIYSIVSRTHTGRESLYHTLKRKNQLQNGPKIVAFGGGTGLATMLRGLKRFTANLTAIVAVTDDGGSSGRLRKEFDLPAPGDLRSCLVALAPEEERLSELVSYRFQNGDELQGHSLGNLLLTALSDLNGGFAEGIRECSEVLAIQGRVLPSMLGSPELQATLDTGTVTHGETQIAESNGIPTDLSVKPNPVKPNPEAIASVVESELIIVGPGSIYTSILTNFLEPELCKTVAQSDTPKVYICNLMTQPGETDGFSASDHIEAFKDVPPSPIEFDHVIVNTRKAPQSRLREYQKKGAEQVLFDYNRISSYDAQIHAGDFISVENLIRHDNDAIRKKIKSILDQELERI